jgi:hypothetical protein
MVEVRARSSRLASGPVRPDRAGSDARMHGSGFPAILSPVAGASDGAPRSREWRARRAIDQSAAWLEPLGPAANESMDAIPDRRALVFPLSEGLNLGARAGSRDSGSLPRPAGPCVRSPQLPSAPAELIRNPGDRSGTCQGLEALDDQDARVQTWISRIFSWEAVFLWIVMTAMALHKRDVYFWSLGSTDHNRWLFGRHHHSVVQWVEQSARSQCDSVLHANLRRCRTIAVAFAFSLFYNFNAIGCLLSARRCFSSLRFSA